MPMYQEGEISVDLMRYRDDAPNGIMDALFIRMFLWAKEEGARRLTWEWRPWPMSAPPLHPSGQKDLPLSFLIMSDTCTASAASGPLKKNTNRSGAANTWRTGKTDLFLSPCSSSRG